ncbi:hypothetical protein [Natrarchaeobaculum aegyptiacum]|uniref:Uncharacterized protein n=1 Tax=Natrarchaeobaculum aegyptiacum TaxID=745377 RepID=A0A2Z2HXG5_9EURY|nr:hypothetical protein [Natrarchaeobaculum aegyptiacum]ARS91583.1 hypothetical protein B1756_18875 [Natrarchaeobaculum aegyptiacum]
MKAKIIGIEDGVIGVEVIHPRGNQHIIEIPVDNDEASDYHGQNAYPHSSEERTEDQEHLMNQVFARARFEAHINTNYDILLSDWDPRQLRRGIDALEKMPLNQFDEAFREYYHALIDPERTKQEYGLTEGRVEFEGEPRIALIMKGFCINDENEVVEVLPDMYIYYSKEDIEETYTTGTPASCSEGTTQITPMVPPFVEVPEDFVYPEDFRGFLINNLIYQIRDIYRNMGETPPKQYDIEGYGKPKGNFDRDEY